MIRIAISQAAFEAISATLPLGSVGYENGRQRERRASDLARAERGRPVARHARAGESYSDVILRLAAGDA